jgi:hypothetical protein
MKKIFNLMAVLGLLTVILLIAIAARKKEFTGEPNITGKWITKIANSPLVQQYEFRNDHTFEYSLVNTDPANKKVTGISAKTVGRYEAKDTQLNLYDVVSYENKKQRFGPVSELVIIDNAKTINNNIALNDLKNTLSVFFKCPPSADCFPSPVIYYKQ